MRGQGARGRTQAGRSWLVPCVAWGPPSTEEDVLVCSVTGRLTLKCIYCLILRKGSVFELAPPNAEFVVL